MCPKEKRRWADILSVVVAEAGWRGRHPPGPHRSFLAGLWDGVNALRVYPIVAYRVDCEAFRTPRSWIILDLFCCDLTKRTHWRLHCALVHCIVTSDDDYVKTTESTERIVRDSGEFFPSDCHRMSGTVNINSDPIVRP